MPREPAKQPHVSVRRDVTITIPRVQVMGAIVQWAQATGHLPAGQANVSVDLVCDDYGGDRPSLSEAVITYREETPDAG